MSSPVDRWKLGLFVVGGAALSLAGLTWLGMASLQRPTHAAYAFFDEPLVGLEPGSPVKFRGVSIGVVDSIRLAPDKKHLQVLAALYDDKLEDLGFDTSALGPDCEFPPDLRAQLVTSYLTQTSFVLVDFSSGDPSVDRKLPFVPPKNTIRTVRSTFRSVEDGLRDVLRELPDVAHSSRLLLEKARVDLEALHLPDLAQRLDRTLEAVTTRVRDLEQLGVVRSAEAAFAETAALARELRDQDGPVRAAVRDLAAVAGDLRQALVEFDAAATGRSVRAAGDGAAALLQDLRGELQYARRALASVERLAELLERDPGALLRGRSPTASPLRDR